MDFGFTLAIDIDLDEETLTTLLERKLADSERHGGYIKISNNIMKTEKNFDYNPAKVCGLEDDWEFYRYNLDVTPLGDVTEQEQRLLAKLLKQIVDDHGGRSFILSEFKIQ